jgi:hypothetical protein
MTDAPEYPPIDLYAIPLPSDKLTLGQVRAIEGKVNGTDGAFVGGMEMRSSRCRAIPSLITLSYEMELAENAYERALGFPDGEPAPGRAELVRRLRELWAEDGLSTGDKATEEMIRAIERAATRQAEKHLGRNR